jgi:hypothetical protein
MRILDKLKKMTMKVCVFCGNGGDIKKEKDNNMYGSIKYYHNKCFLSILSSPENHTHLKVDVALEIEDLIKYRKSEEKKKNDFRMSRIIRAQNRLKREGEL